MPVLLWAHDQLPALPEGMPPVRLVTSLPSLLAARPDDVLILGEPAFPVPLAQLPRCALLLSWRADAVSRARALGWRAYQLPGLDGAAIARAVSSPDALVAVERGSLDLGAGTLWTAAGCEALPRRELEALALLLANAPEAIDRSALHKPEGTLRRLRARLGSAHLVAEGGKIRFCALSPPPTVASAVPSRRPVTLGASLIDIDGQRVVHPDRELALSTREARALTLLLDAPGVVPRGELASSMGLSPSHRRAIDLSILRLRSKLDPIELLTVRGQGYRLVRALASILYTESVDPTGIHDELLALLAVEPMVSVTGPCGVGKSHLARRVADKLDAQAVDLHGVEPSLVVRILSRQPDTGPLLWLDGLDDAATVAPALAHLARSRRLLITARAASGLPGEHEVRVAPWPLEALRTLAPAASPEHDGLPLAALEPAALPRRLEALSPEILQALRALSVYAGWFEDPDARAAGCALSPRSLERLGWLEGAGPWRLRRPVLIWLRSAWSERERAQHAQLAARRTDAALERRPFLAEIVRHTCDDLRDAWLATGDPALAVLRAKADQTLCTWDHDASAWLSSALSRAEDPQVRAWLLYFLSTAGEVQVELLRQAAELAAGEQRLEWQLELAWYLGTRGRERESDALLEQIGQQLDALPPDAWLCCRAVYVSLQGRHRPTHEERVAVLAALLGQMEAAQWTREDFPAGHRRTYVARSHVAMVLGRSLMHLRRFAEAESAFRTALDTYPSHQDSPSLLTELGSLAIHQHRWEEAESWLIQAEQAAERVRAPTLAVLALLRRAVCWVFRGEPRRGDVLVARAEGMPGWTVQLRAVRSELRAWRAAALGDPREADQTSLPEPLRAALVAVAEVICAHRSGQPTAETLGRVRALLPAVSALKPTHTVQIEELLARAGLPRA